jgi:hypothetical protein
MKYVLSIKNVSIETDRDKYDKKSKDFNKFNNKKINTIVLSLDNNNYYSIEWTNSINSTDFVKNLIDNNRNMHILKFIDKYSFIIKAKNLI